MAVGEIVLALTAELCSFLACGVLLVRLSRLGETDRRRLFPRQLFQLAIADILFGVGATIQDFIEFSGLWEGATGFWRPKYLCRYWSGPPYFFGRTVSVMTGAHIAVSFVCAAVQADRTYYWLFASLNWLWVWGLILTVIEYWESEVDYQKDASAKCKSHQQDLVAVFILVLGFFVTLSACLVLLCRAWRLRGRPLRIALRALIYPLVFALSYSCILCFYMKETSGEDLDLKTLYVSAQVLQHLNGFFNTVVFLWASYHAHRRSEGRLLASIFSPWTDTWPARGATAYRRSLPGAAGDSRLLLQVCYLEGGGNHEETLEGAENLPRPQRSPPATGRRASAVTGARREPSPP